MCFGFMSVSQWVRWSFFWLMSWPHQKALMMESNFVHMAWGAFKTEKLYIGMKCSTEFMRVSLSAWERSFAVQPWSLPETLWMSSWKSLILLPRSSKLMPKYLPSLSTSLTPNWRARLFCCRSGRFGEQKSSDFSKLMLCPERQQYHAKFCWMIVGVFLSILKKMKESSTNNK